MIVTNRHRSSAGRLIPADKRILTGNTCSLRYRQSGPGNETTPFPAAGSWKGLAALAAATAHGARKQTTAPAAPPSTPLRQAVARANHLTVNGVAQRIEVEDRWTLVEVIRDRRPTGTKIGCGAENAAPAVLLDGRPVYSCASWRCGQMAGPSRPSRASHATAG